MTYKYISIIALAILLTVILFGSLLYGLQSVLGVSGGGIVANSDQAYLITATSSATARSNSYDIQGAERVTFFIGSAFHGNTDSIDEHTATFTFEVSDIPEPAQGAAIYGTSTPITLTYANSQAESLVMGTSSPFLLAPATYGTTTVSLDLRQHAYSFVRVIRTGTADQSTSTVSIIRSY